MFVVLAVVLPVRLYKILFVAVVAGTVPPPYTAVSTLFDALAVESPVSVFKALVAAVFDAERPPGNVVDVAPLNVFVSPLAEVDRVVVPDSISVNAAGKVVADDVTPKPPASALARDKSVPICVEILPKAPGRFAAVVLLPKPVAAVLA